MKAAGLATIGVLAIIGWANPTYAQALAPIDQLRNTRICKGCNFSNADLKGMDLSNTDLSGANLGNADLSGANLANANLSGANLYLAKFSNANLKGANFSSANVKGASLEGADLTGSNLTNANFSYAKLPGANLSGADLNKTNLGDADLSQANLENAKLLVTNLNYANLTGANLSGADLTGSNLETASLKDANFTGANLIQTALAKPSVSAEPGTKDGTASTSGKVDDSVANQTQLKGEESPLAFAQMQTAKTLKPGEVVLNYRQRFYRSSTGVVKGTGTPFFAGPGVQVGVTNNLELSLGAQIFDSSYLDLVGGRVDNPNGDIALAAKYKIWQNEAKTQTLSGIVSLSGFSRGATFRRLGVTSKVDGSGIIPEFQLPFTFDLGEKAQFTISPTLAFFQQDSAVQLPRIPDRGGSYGTTFGIMGAASFRPFSRLMVWGDAFVPFTGNNSLNFKTERPAKTIVFNAGLRYFVNPRLGLDIFATNGFGNLGPLALTGDSEKVGIGAGIVIMPNAVPANRKYPNTFKGNVLLKDTPMTDDGLGFFDGGTVPEGKVLLQFQGGSSGLMAAVRYGVLRDFEFGTYIDYVFGNVDESEQGVSAKVRLLNQADGAPFTAGVAATIGRGNNLLENFRNNDATIFSLSGREKSFPFIGSGDNADTLPTLFIGTLSLPLQYQFKPGTAIWLTPTVGFVQRGGFSLGGINAGGSIRVFKDVSILGEVGVNFVGDGNAFINNRLANRIPWNVAIRWTPSKVLGLDFSSSLARPSLELFVTNRVGASAWHQFRVREQNNPAVGVGISIPF